MKASRGRVAVDDHHLWDKDGTWYVRYQFPEALGGKRTSISTGTGNLAQAAAMRDRILGPILAEEQVGEVARRLLSAMRMADDQVKTMVGALTAAADQHLPSGPTLGEAALRFLDNRQHFKGRSGHTIDDYERTLQIVQRCLGNLRLNQIVSKDIRTLRDWLRGLGRYQLRNRKRDKQPSGDGPKISNRTVVKHLKNFSTFLNWAEKEELIPKNPAKNIDLPTIAHHYTPAPRADQVDALCSLPYPESPTVGRLDWEVLPWFYRYTGARCGEIGRLTVGDVVVQDGIRCLLVFTEKTGTRGAQTQDQPKRLVPVHARLAPHLDRLLAERGAGGAQALLFSQAGTRPFSKGRFLRYAYGWANLFNRHCKAVWAGMHVHCWRSYAITEMARAGIPEEVRRRVVGHAVRGVHDGYTQVDVQRLAHAVGTIP